MEALGTEKPAGNPDRYRRQSMILVPLPHPGVVLKRMLPVFGYDEAPHGHAEVVFDNVRVPAANMLLGEGRGFEIAQGRLGPGRIHHCMQLIGLAERALERMCRRAATRTAFGARVADQTVTQERIAEARIMIEEARLLTLKAAWMMDKYGNKEARAEIAMIKVAAPNMACRVIDWAIQAFGGAGVTGDYGLAYAYATARVLRLADGPDEVHRNQIARLELRKYQGPASLTGARRSTPGAGGTRVRVGRQYLGRARRNRASGPAFGSPPDEIERYSPGIDRIARSLTAGKGARARIHALLLAVPEIVPEGMAKLARAAALRKTNPDWSDQPRNPAGSPEGGQWASDGDDDQYRERVDFQPAAAPTNDVQERKRRFVDTHLVDAQKGADELRLPVENILAGNANTRARRASPAVRPRCCRPTRDFRRRPVWIA
jgi:hypothetical protein